MALTVAQASTFKTAVLADGPLAAAVTAKDWPTITANYNAPSATLVWMPSVTASRISAAIAPAIFGALTTPQALGVCAMLSAGSIDTTDAGIRAWFTGLFSGATLTALTANSQRLATKFENLFVASSVSSAFGIVLSPLDVQQAMGF